MLEYIVLFIDAPKILKHHKTFSEVAKSRVYNAGMKCVISNLSTALFFIVMARFKHVTATSTLWW